MFSFTNTVRWKLDRQTWNDVKKQSQQLAKQLDKTNPQNILNESNSKRRKAEQDSHIKHYRKLQLEQNKFAAMQKKVLLRFAQSTSAIRDMGVAEKKVLLNKLKQASSTEELLHLEKKLKNQISDRNRKEKQRTKELAKQAALVTHTHNERRKAAVASLKNVGMTVGVVGAGLATVGMQQSLQKATELDQAIKKSNLDSETFQNLAAASSRFGLSMDQVASNYQDFADRLGEFRLTGSGEFKDIAEWLQQNSKITTKMLESLDPLEIIHLIQKEAERRGTDMRDLTFLMESFSSEAINQFKAMNNLAEIQAQRERFNLNLTQQDIDTLVKARQNITLMGEGFGRLMDQFLVGFGGGDINNVMTNLKELQPTFRNLGESVRSFVNFATQHGDELITIGKAIASIWVGSKIFTVMSGGLTVVKTLTNSFKGLFKLISRAAGALGLGSATSASVKGGAAARAGGAGARLAGGLRGAAGLASRANPWLMAGMTIYEGRPGGMLDPENFFGKNKYTDFLNTSVFDLLGRMGKQISSIQNTQPQKVDLNLHVHSEIDGNGNIKPFVRSEIDSAEEERMINFYSNLSPSN